MAITNPYYIAYGRANGRTAEEQLEHDKVAFPGGCMCGYTLWISKQKQAFKIAHPEAFLFDSIMDHAAWGRWLEAAPALAEK